MAVGDFITVLKPKIWFSASWGTQVLPPQSLPYNANWNAGSITGWVKVPYTANGAQWTMVNPKQDIPTDEIGPIDTVPAGTDTVNVTFQQRTAIWELIKKICSFHIQTIAPRAHVETLTVTSGATSAGNATVTLAGLAPVTVALLSGDTTPAQVATKVAAATYTGWTAVVSGATVTFTAAATGDAPSGTFSYSGGSTGSAGTMAATTIGTYGWERATLDPDVDPFFILGMEGHTGPNSLKLVQQKIRVFGYRVEQTENPQLHLRTHGADSPVQPTTTARCLPNGITAPQLVGSGLSFPDDVDSRGRFDWFNINEAT